MSVPDELSSASDIAGGEAIGERECSGAGEVAMEEGEYLFSDRMLLWLCLRTAAEPGSDSFEERLKVRGVAASDKGEV